MFIFKYLSSVCSVILIFINLVLFIFYPHRDVIGLIDLAGFGILMLSYFSILVLSKRFDRMNFRDLWFLLGAPIVFPLGAVLGFILLIV